MMFATNFSAPSTDKEHTMTGLMHRLLHPFANRDGESSPSTTIKVHLSHANRFPQTRVEQIAVAMLSAHEPMPLNELAEQLAESLYRDELRHGGWVADLGLFGPSLFVADALQALQAGDGELWKIVGPEAEQ